MDARLRKRDGLLLHCLMDRHLVLDIHLVKLVDTANTVVSEHKRARLDAKVARLRVLNNARSQTGGAGRLSAGVDGAGQELADVL